MVVSVLVAVRIKVSRQVGRKEGSCDQAADSSACDRALRVTRRTRVCLEEGGGEPLGLSGPARGGQGLAVCPRGHSYPGGW